MGAASIFRVPPLTNETNLPIIHKDVKNILFLFKFFVFFRAIYLCSCRFSQVVLGLIRAWDFVGRAQRIDTDERGTRTIRIRVDDRRRP